MPLVPKATEAVRAVLGEYASPAKCEAVARAVLEAIREPTEAMLDAGWPEVGRYWCENYGDPMDIVVDGRPSCPEPVDPALYDPSEPLDGADRLNARGVYRAMVDAALTD